MKRIQFHSLFFALSNVLLTQAEYSYSYSDVFEFSSSPAEDLQPMFDVVSGQENHWIGADCATSLAGVGPDGSTLWIFQDTNIGTMTDTGNGSTVRNSSCMPHNSLGTVDVNSTTMTHLMRGECSPRGYPYDAPASNGFFVPPRRRQWYWVETGARTSNDKLFLFAQRMDYPCGIGCNQLGIDLIQILDEVVWNYTTEQLPGFAHNLNWPSAIGEDGDILYFLGYQDTVDDERNAILLRLTNRDDLDEGWDNLEFYVYDNDGLPSWQLLPESKNVRQLDFVALFHNAAPETSLEWNDYMQRWFTLAIPFGTGHLQIRTSENVTGPWTHPKTIFNIPEPWVSDNAFAYSPKHHKELITEPNELMLTFMSNTEGDGMGPTGVYVPQAVRVIVSLKE